MKIRDFFTDKTGRPVVFQAPNPPIIAWAVFSILSFLFKKGVSHTLFQVAASVSLLYWAYLEIKDGQSPFRRVLGSIVAVGVILGIIYRLFAMS